MKMDRSTPIPRRRPAATVPLWTVQIVLSVVFVVIAVARLTGSPAAVETFDQIGLGQWLRFVTGVAELAGGIGLLIPRLAGAAALGLAGVMVGATAANLLVLNPVMAVLTVLLGVAAVAVAVARWAETRSLLEQLRR